MSIFSRKYWSVLVLLLALLATGRADDNDKDGTLAVFVTWGDVDNTPATNAYVEAYGFVRRYDSKKSFVLKRLRPGQYEASIPPGVYDVFVSAGTSVPACKRVLIRTDSTTSWTLKLKVDYVYTEK